MFDVRNIFVDIAFNCEAFENEFSFDRALDPFYVQKAIEKIEDSQNSGNQEFKNVDLTQLKKALSDHENDVCTVSKEDIKEVFCALRDRKKNPRGKFEKSGKFYVYDSELVTTVPSGKYPYRQLKEARALKFVKALAEKYKCKNKEELEKVAFA